VEHSIRRHARLAAIGALGVAAGAIALFALLAATARPTPTGGIDPTESMVAWISIAVPVALIVAVHVAYARVLQRESLKG
jgi:hypothetical protein